MLNAIRRGPASIVKSAHSSFPAICTRSILSRPLSRGLYQTLSKPYLLRQFSVSPFSKQGAAHAEAIENDIADEVTAQRPPSDAQINEAVRHGPVTKFKELGERRMVCPTVVRTLTEDMRLETMTQVQSLTINEILKGGDVYVQCPLNLLSALTTSIALPKLGLELGRPLPFSYPSCRTSSTMTLNLNSAGIANRGHPLTTSEPSSSHQRENSPSRLRSRPGNWPVIRVLLFRQRLAGLINPPG